MVLADNNPILAGGGQIGAIVIGLYALIFILIALVFNLAMAVAFSWVHEKAKLVKMLRPTVESVNKTSEAMIQGTQPPANGNKVVQIVAQGPAQVHKLDKQVDQVTDKATNALIEFRARTIQMQTVAKAFFVPNLLRRELEQHDKYVAEHDGTQIKSPGLRMLIEEKVPDAPVVPTPRPTDGVVPSIPASQLKKDVSTR